jgi:hypothetical protein
VSSDAFSGWQGCRADGPRIAASRLRRPSGVGFRERTPSALQTLEVQCFAGMWEDAPSGKEVYVRVHVIAALSFFWWLIFIFFWVVFLMLTMSIARSKGYSPLLWGLLACILPLITVIILLVLPARSQA